VTRLDDDRLDDITAAIVAIRSHVARGSLADDLVTDAVRVRLIEIGEAVKGLTDGLRATEPDIPWRRIAGMRDHLTHRYFLTSHEIVQSTVDDDLGELESAVTRMRARVDE